MKPMNKYLLYEIVVNGYPSPGNTIQQISFTDNQFLRDKYITSLEAFTNVDIPFAPSGLPVVTSAIFKNASLNLYGNDPETQSNFGNWLQNIPLVSIHRQVNGTDGYVYEQYLLMPRQISWTMSQISISQQPLNTAAFSFLFGVGYANSF